MSIDCYRQYLKDKCRDEPKPRQITEVPLCLRDQYSSVDEYNQALHEFLNGN